MHLKLLHSKTKKKTCHILKTFYDFKHTLFRNTKLEHQIPNRPKIHPD